MKLTLEQQKTVADNHNLIYWYANMKRLSVDDWYDILALALCYAVMYHDAEKSNLSTYYKLRADWAVYKEMQKFMKSPETAYIENAHGIAESDDFEMIEKDDWFNKEYGDILKLRLQGYSQREIAEKLGYSQSQISNILKKAKADYNETYR